MSTSKYEQRGVSSSKAEVHAAIKHLDKGLFPTAFCKILPDVVGNDPHYCNVMHADTAGTKTSLAYLYWQETGDYSVWKGIAQDALVMNLDDMGCVGCWEDIVISSTIGRNKYQIDGKVIATLIEGVNEFVELLAAQGVRLHLSGGETADVGDIVRTLDVGFTTFARMPRASVIVNDIQAGAAIIGVASYGQATYETAYNSGIGSNGLTGARHDVLHHSYAQRFPESFDPAMPTALAYSGNYRLTDTYGGYEIGQLLLSPTRTYLPILKTIGTAFRQDIQGIIHCTGGAQTKVLKFVSHKKIIKHNLLPTPPVFELIQSASHTPWQEMYQVLNMGHRLELYVRPQVAAAMCDTIRQFGIDAQIIGHVEDAAHNEVLIDSPYGTFSYSA